MTIQRNAKQALLRLASQFPVVGITGPRQSGKTTLVRLVFQNKKYISFDDKNMRELAAANPNDFIMAFPDGAIFDEAQKVPEIFDALKLHIDNTQWTPGKFILTGSSQFKLRKNMSDSMAGRAAFLTLLPFAISELKNANRLPDYAYSLILKGNYPPLYDNEKHFIADDWYKNYIDTYIEKDISELINQKNLMVFRKFIQMCAVYSGQLISMENIAKEIGISAVTVKSWLSILESSFIIHFLPPFYHNLGKQMVKTPKLYFVDSGLLCYLLKINSVEELLLSHYKGAVIETFAVSELLKQRFNQGKKSELYFYRDKYGFEIDAIADWQQSFAIEIKSHNAPEHKLSANVRKYAQLNPNTKTAVFYLGENTMNINQTLYLAWQEWGNFDEMK